MKRAITVLLASLLLLTSGCSNKEVANNPKNQEEQKKNENKNKPIEDFQWSMKFNNILNEIKFPNEQRGVLKDDGKYVSRNGVFEVNFKEMRKSIKDKVQSGEELTTIEMSYLAESVLYNNFKNLGTYWVGSSARKGNEYSIKEGSYSVLLECVKSGEFTQDKLLRLFNADMLANVAQPYEYDVKTSNIEVEERIYEELNFPTKSGYNLSIGRKNFVYLPEFKMIVFIAKNADYYFLDKDLNVIGSAMTGIKWWEEKTVKYDEKKDSISISYAGFDELTERDRFNKALPTQIGHRSLDDIGSFYQEPYNLCRVSYEQADTDTFIVGSLVYKPVFRYKK